jgi:hypothetical protein
VFDWDEGQNEMFRDTDRIALEMNHSLTQNTFYTIRYSRFKQAAFTGVRWKDSDSDGYPDWFELSHGAGDRTNGAGDKSISDPHNPLVVPFMVAGDGSIDYVRKDGEGPQDWNSGWYHDAAPGNYNWTVAEPFVDVNNDGIYQVDIDEWDSSEDDFDGNGHWTGPALVQKCTYRDGSYWLTPEMYVNHENIHDLHTFQESTNSFHLYMYIFGLKLGQSNDHYHQNHLQKNPIHQCLLDKFHHYLHLQMALQLSNYNFQVQHHDTNHYSNLGALHHPSEHNQWNRHLRP